MFQNRILLIFTIAMTLILSLNVIGQKSIDELEAQLKTAKSDNNSKLEVETYILMGDYFIKEEDNINKGQRFYRRSNRKNKDDEFVDLTILYHRQYARSYVLQNKLEDASTHYQDALSLAKEYKLKNYVKNLSQEIEQFEARKAQIIKAKQELDELKSLKDDEAIARIEERNQKEDLEAEKFFLEINKLSRENQLQQIKLRFVENELEKKELKIQLLDQYNKAKAAEIEKHNAEIALKNLEIEKKEVDAKRQNNIILFFIITSLLLFLIVFIIFFNYKKLKKLNLLLSEQSLIIKQKNKEMTDSLNYAQRIQEAIFLGSKSHKSIFPEYFIFNQPKDIVSGDFFWSGKTHDNKIAWAVVDCTGHGVPGAFMSIIGVRLLNEIIVERKITDPGKVLDEMKRGIIHSLNQEENQTTVTQDGMDMTLCIWDPITNELKYAGANNSIYILREGINSSVIPLPENKYKSFENDLLEIRANRSPIGYYPYFSHPFDTITFQLQKGDIIYALSDGFQDQFGGTKNKKYTTKRMKRFMTDVSVKSFTEQTNSFQNELNTWKGNYEQLDDVCIVGVRV